MGRHQCPPCWAKPHRGPCPKGSCAQQAPGAAQDEPTLGCMHWPRSCRGLASDAAGSGISTIAQPAPLLIPGTLLAPRTSSLGGTARGSPAARPGSPAAAAGTLLLAPAVFCGLRCWRAALAPFSASRDAGHSPGIFHLCHVTIAVLQSLLFPGRGAAQLRAIAVGAEPSEPHAHYCSPYQTQAWPFDFSTCFRSQQHQTQPRDANDQSQVAGRHSSSSPCCFGSGLFCFVVSPMSGGCRTRL